MTDSTHLPESIDAAKFSVVRKGYDKREVRDYLQELEAAFREMENWSKRAKVQLAEAEERLASSQSEADGSVDNAMFAVFDAKDRILEKARRRAEQIEEEALAEAAEIKARAERLSGDGDTNEILAAAREEAQDIIDRAKREAAKLSAASGDIDSLQRQMVQKDQQLASMRDQLVASKTSAQIGSSDEGEMVVQAQAMADQIIREAQEKAERIVARAEGQVAEGGDGGAIIEAAERRAAEIEARANQLRATAEEVLADAQVKYAAAKEAEAAAAQAVPAGFGDISDGALLAGMEGELREVHEKVETRRSELTELHDLVEERRSELTDIHDAVEARRLELAEIDSEVEARRIELRDAFDAAEAQRAEAEQAAAKLAELQSSGGEGTDVAAALAEAEEIRAKAQQEASQVRADAMRLLAEAERERASLREMGEPDGDGAAAGRIAELENEITELRASQDKAKQQSAAWSEVVDELKAQVADLTAQLESREAALEAAGAEGDAAALHAQIAELTAALDARDGDVTTATAALREEGDALATRVAELNSQLEGKEKALAEAGAAGELVGELEAQLEAAREQLEAKDTELASAAEAGARVGDLERQLAEVAAQLEAKSAELDSTSATLREEADGLAARVAELSSQVEAKENELASARAELDSTSATLREEADALAARVAELSGQVEAKDAELASAAEAGARVGDLERQLAEVAAQLEAKSAELDSTSATLREEADALAARVAELSGQVEDKDAALTAAQSRASRVEPLSNELTKAQVALREQRAEMEKVVEIGAIASELKVRVQDLEYSLGEARAEAAELPKLRVQVDGLKIRADKAEEAAEFANSQLTDLIAQAENFEKEAIRRAAAAEAARIREMTEDSLGIAREATAGSGLDRDDYVAVSVEPIAVSSDPDDWSDVFAAADAITARLAAQDVAVEIDAESAGADSTQVHAVAQEASPSIEGDDRVADESLSDVVAESAERPQSDNRSDVAEVDEGAGDVAEAAEAEQPSEEQPEAQHGVADFPVEMHEDEGEPEVEQPEVGQPEAELPEGGEPEAELVVDGGQEAGEPEVGHPDSELPEDGQPEDERHESEQPAALQPATEETSELAATEAPAAESPDASADEVVIDSSELPIGGEDSAVVEASLQNDDEPVAVDTAADPEAIEDSAATEADTLVDVPAQEPAVAETQPESTTAEEAPADALRDADAAAATGPTYDEAEQSELGATPHDADVDPAPEVAAAPEEAPSGLSPSEEPAAALLSVDDDVVADAATQAPVAESGEEAAQDHVPTDGDPDQHAEVVPIGMAERLRLARAELEAELDPQAPPAEQIPESGSEGEASAVAAVVDPEDEMAEGGTRPRSSQTRYARQSAKLPRITESDSEDADDLGSLSRFRARMLRSKGKDSD